MARITLNNVSKSWGDTSVLKPMNLTIENGEFVAILGPSGCGKSTTLFLLAGLYAPSAGEIAFDGHDVSRVDARDRNVGIVFQSYALYPNLTVRENIAFPLRFKTMDKQEIARRVEEAAALVQIGALSIGGRRNCRADSSSASRLPVRSSRSRTFCCSMSRSPISTPPCASPCGRN